MRDSHFHLLFQKGDANMDGIFEKFGLFDFLGIMGPGIISTSYYTTCYILLTENSALLKESKYNVFAIVIFIFLSYFYGIILHEIGKIVYDHGIKFDIEKNTNRLCEKYGCNSNNRLNKIDSEFEQYIKTIRCFVCKTDFNYALSDLKYSNCNLKKIDAYHSIYGQSRGLMISFIIHFICLYLFCLVKMESIHISTIQVIPCIFVFDFLMIILFQVRSYRYYMSWIRNVYYQYYFECNKKT